MQKLRFTKQINAPRTRVWNTLWDDATYRSWTSVFHEGSQAESDWQEGSRILFIDNSRSGMISKIARLIPNEFMSFEHLGEIKEGVEDFETARAKGWAGAHENYTLAETAQGTELTVELDIDEAFGSYFLETFPKALDKVKSLAELQKITTFLTYNDQAEAAMNLYLSVFKNARLLHEQRMGGQFFTGSFQIEGQKFMVLNGGPHFAFSQGISLFVHCEGQEEVDELWEKLSEGGEKLQCGWLKDKFGVSWQIIPAALGQYMGDPDPVKANNVSQAMLKMTKIDIALLKEAYERGE
jgi:predicted 3-demethylubiquinone-9 3-methyltransferase (glyoxalase superfamily)/uncharacterized protein YndB with AHSA1/START domain